MCQIQHTGRPKREKEIWKKKIKCAGLLVVFKQVRVELHSPRMCEGSFQNKTQKLMHVDTLTNKGNSKFEIG